MTARIDSARPSVREIRVTLSEFLRAGRAVVDGRHLKLVAVYVSADENGSELINARPVVGAPATIHLYNDTMAAVVVRVNKKSITVARVATDRNTLTRINSEREPFPCLAEEGILTEVIGDPERYTMSVKRDGTLAYRNGSISVTLGKSVRITDYRY